MTRNDVVSEQVLTSVPPRMDGEGADLAAVLRKRIQGEVRFDTGSRALYATDLSIYRQPPVGVVTAVQPMRGDLTGPSRWVGSRSRLPPPPRR